MNSREKILSALKKNQPAFTGLPDISAIKNEGHADIERFKSVLINIGGSVIEVKSYDEVLAYIRERFDGKNIISTVKELSPVSNYEIEQNPHLLENVTLAILPANFGVAESGAVWITDSEMGDRALPYITEHLALVLNKDNIVATLQEAYQLLESSHYNLGTFIAGPSKTADIEQSLVLGAHGAKTLTIFLKG